MKLLLIAAAMAPSGVQAFLTSGPFNAESPRHPMQVFAVDKALTKKTGGGGGVISPGDLSLYDPNEEGLLQGSGALQDRIASGSSFVYSAPSDASSLDILTEATQLMQEHDRLDKEVVGAGAAPAGVHLHSAEHWLEHLDIDGAVPTNFAKPNAPVQATVLGRTRLISDDAPGDIEHIIMRLPAGFHYVEGQSLSVIPPGVDAKSGRAQKPRLYSIASTRYGDILDGNTVSLCVRRAEYYDPETGLIDPSKKGVCSNFLCDAVPGTSISVAGPVGKTMLLPKDPTKDVIMIATGTGIAPFRGFMHRLFMENTLSRHLFGGTAWLVLGVPVTGGLVYKEEFDCMLRNTDQLKIDYAISREMKNVNGGKLYVQDVIAQNADELFARLDSGAVAYFCGLKGMMPPILETLEKVAAERGVAWSEKLTQLKKNGQWHVEVY